MLRRVVAKGLAVCASNGMAWFAVAWWLTLAQVQVQASDFERDVRPILDAYCVACHTSDDPSGDVDFDGIRTPVEVEEHFATWAKAVERLAAREMPPDDQPQPTEAERELLRRWYQAKFVDEVVARPGTFRPRRLSATEYRNTLRSLVGFDLELAVMEAEQTRVEKSLVLKLLPTDPPGKSGFRNDTHHNPLTTVIWDQYSYLADSALEELFSPGRREALERLAGKVDDAGLTLTGAERLIRCFVPKAYRRQLAEEQLLAMVERVRQGRDTVEATKSELKVVLMSPAFLYRGLLFEGVSQQQQKVDDFELAERLSYFLWADMPDSELMQLAAEQRLGQPDILAAQVDRMLDSPKSNSLAEDFAVQWLTLDDIDQVSDETPYVMALRSQPIDFLKYLFAEDRPLIELIDSQIAYANPLTKRFYPRESGQLAGYRKPKGIEVEAVPNQQITLENTPERGGLLTMPGIVAMNRGPIIRGTWVLERILGEELPDPPANVGQVAANQLGEESKTFRKRFEEHRSNASCASCHDKIDPLGFALQAYDQAGAYVLATGYRPSKKQKASEIEYDQVVDASGQLPSGEEFEDFEGLKEVLVTTQREAVIRNLVDRLLSYALCRKLEYYDQPTIDEMVQRLMTNGTYRQLVHEIVRSLPFRQTYIP